MKPEEKDVISDPSTENQDQVTAEPEQQNEEIVDTEEVQPDEQTPEPGQAPEAVDENGVPWKNRAMEGQRKFNELVDKLPDMLEKAVSSNTKSDDPYERATDEQLESFIASSDTDPAHRLLAMKKLRERTNNQVSKVIEEKFAEQKSSDQKRGIERQATGYVAKNFPDVFLRDENGRFIQDGSGRLQWNPKSQHAAAMNQILQDPRFEGQPDAMQIAAELTAFRLGQEAISNTTIVNFKKHLHSNGMITIFSSWFNYS
jgi:hypothetical protein